VRQIWITRHGGPEVLELREADDPVAGPGQVRIRVAASGLNFADVMARVGLYPDAPPVPCVVGYEVAGTVDAIGEGVTEIAVGARVLALTRFGGHADVVVVPAAQALVLPDGLPFAKAAAIPVTYLTAWLMLVELGNVHAGHIVLVHAVAGGVGQAALQICRHRGARVIGTASASKHARLLEAGVAVTIDYRTQDFETEVMRATDGRGVDIALDAVGGASFAKSYRCLAPMGRLFMFGISSFAPGRTRSVLAALGGLLRMPRFGAVRLMNENKGVLGVNLGHLWQREAELGAMLREVVELVGRGVLDPIVDCEIPFAEAARAHERLQDRGNFGKVVLVP
jgi:NADPH:quinone reductase-like Zn-dependent oxidoreductase